MMDVLGDFGSDTSKAKSKSKQDFLAGASMNKHILPATKAKPVVEEEKPVVNTENLAEIVAKARAEKTVNGKVKKPKVIKKTATIYNEATVLKLEWLALESGLAEGNVLASCVDKVYELVNQGKITLK